MIEDYEVWIKCLKRVNDRIKELQKLAGLELEADSSGKNRGKTKISKRGSRHLRYLLFAAVISVVGKNEEFKEIHRYLLLGKRIHSKSCSG